VLLSPSWTEPDRTRLMGSARSDLKVFQVAVQSNLKNFKLQSGLTWKFQVDGVDGVDD